MNFHIARIHRQRIAFVALVLVVLTLSGGTPLRAEAQNPESGGRMKVNWSRSTPPVGPGKICRGRQYKIFAWPYVLFPDGTWNLEFHAYGATVSIFAPPQVGTLTPPSARLLAGSGGPPALFHYSSDNIGQESLLFTAIMPRPVVITEIDANTGSRMEVRVERVGAPFNFEVIECQYKVTLVVRWDQNFAGAREVVNGLRATTRLVRNEDGTFESNAPLIFYSILTNVPDCNISLGNMEVPVHVTGKLVPEPGDPSGRLHLTFEYGTGTMQGDARCKEVPKVSRSTTFDLSSANESIDFPGEGRITKRATRVPPGVILSITVEPETVGTR